MENLQKLSLDIMNNHTYDYIFANQDDVGRTVEITITDNNEPMDLRGVKAVFFMKKPDGTTVTNDVSVRGSVVTVVITAEMTSCPGKAAYQIKLEKEPNFISTIKGVFLVESSAIQEGDMPSGHESTMWEDVVRRSDETEYYWEQVKAMVAGDVNQEGLIPMGAIYFSQLTSLTPSPRQLYTIKDAFVSDDTFLDGGGVSYPGGVNVYRNADNNKWIAIPGAYLSIANNVPTNGTGVWLEEYDPGADPGPTPPSYNDDVFFTSGYDSGDYGTSRGLGQVIYDHIVSFNHPISFVKSDTKRGCPYMMDDGESKTIYLDFTVNADNTQTVWWWSDDDSDFELNLYDVFRAKGDKHGDLLTDGYLAEAINYYDFRDMGNIKLHGYYEGHYTSDILSGKQDATILIDNCSINGYWEDDRKQLFGFSEDLTFSGNNLTLYGNPEDLFDNTSVKDDELNISNWTFLRTSFPSQSQTILGAVDIDKVIARNWSFLDGYSGFPVPRLYKISTTYGNPISYLDLTGWSFNSSSLIDESIGNVFQVYDEALGEDKTIFDNGATVIGIDTWDVSRVQNMAGLFYNAHPNTVIDLSQWDVSSVVDMQHIFEKSDLSANTCNSISNWDVSNVEYFGYAFSESCANGYDFSFLDNWNIDQDADFNWIMHQDNHYDMSIRLPKWNGWFSYYNDGTYYPYEHNRVPGLSFQGLLYNDSYLPTAGYDLHTGYSYTLLEEEQYVYWDGDVWRTKDEEEYVPGYDPES